MISALEAAGIPYMLTGSFASSYHGTPRATQDIDVVIAPTAAQLRAFVAQLPPTDYYVDEQTAVAALQAEAQFNVIDFATGWKLDLIICKSRPFSQTELSRRLVVDYLGMPLAITTAEDVLLAKLEWAKLGQSARQIEDAAGILRVRQGQLDLQYIGQWVRQLGLTSQWHAACRAAGLEPTTL